MHWWEAVVIMLAGMGAGAINAAVGSGTLITFPILLTLGFAPVTANVSNNIGLVPGGMAGAWGYRRELGGRRPDLIRLIPCSAVGGAVGAVLLLQLPADAFKKIVPVLIAIALVLVVSQPWLASRVARRRTAPDAAVPADAGASADAGVPTDAGVSRDAGVSEETAGPTETAVPARAGRKLEIALMVGVFAAGMYGGYFGAAQGVLLIGLLGWLLTDSLQIANGLKNVLSSVVNGVAALTFLVIAPDRVNWAIVLLIAVGSTIGGVLGASLGRRLPPRVLRGLIVVVGLVAIIRLLV